MSVAKQRQERRERVLREFEQHHPKLALETYQLRAVYVEMLLESKTHVTPDRALIAQMAASICSGGTDAKNAVRIARAILVEIDGAEPAKTYTTPTVGPNEEMGR